MVLEVVHCRMMRLLMLKNTDLKSLNAVGDVCWVSEK